VNKRNYPSITVRFALSALVLVGVGGRALAVELKLINTASAGFFCNQALAFCPDGGAVIFFPLASTLPPVVKSYGGYLVTHRLVGIPAGTTNIAYGNIELPLSAAFAGTGGPWDFWDVYLFYVASTIPSAHIKFDPQITSGLIRNMQTRIRYIRPEQIISSIISQDILAVTSFDPEPIAGSIGWSVAGQPTLDSVTDLAAGLYVLEIRGNVVGQKAGRFKPFVPVDATYRGYLSVGP
jgi:hypothetical protein